MNAIHDDAHMRELLIDRALGFADCSRLQPFPASMRRRLEVRARAVLGRDPLPPAPR